VDEIKRQARLLAAALKVCGLMNIQFAVTGLRFDGTPTEEPQVYILEANPRASRTIPFVSKATGVPIARIAALVMAGKKLRELGLPEELSVKRFFIKSPVFPFAKFPGVDPVLSPEMHSTGEVMGIGDTFGEAYAKAMMGAGLSLPSAGKAFLSVNDADKGTAVLLARRLSRLGFDIIATLGTAARLLEVGMDVETVFKVNEGRPNIVDHIKSGEISLVINTPLGRASHYDDKAIRRAALQYGVPCVTTMTGATALVEAIGAHEALPTPNVHSLQELHAMRVSADCELPIAN
jgi:carbamoyl-phosphate synthase large subunit